MAQSSWRSLREHLHRLAGSRAVEESSDADLLLRWINLRDEAAFELLVWRHGGMVLDLCQRMLSSASEAEDAFQATFLVLVKKAKSVRQREALASWLYKVAVRVALAARTQTARRRTTPLTADVVPAREAADDLAQQETQALVSEEVARLPERYRTPIVLCCLQGLTVDQATAVIGCSRWTLATRLARAKERLRARLVRRELAISSAALAALLTQAGAGSAAAALVQTTITNACSYAAQGSLPAGASANVALLVNAALHTPVLTRLATLTALAFCLAVGGAGWALYRPPADHPPAVASSIFQQAETPADPLDNPLAVIEEVPPPGPDHDRFLGLEAVPVIDVAPDGLSIRVMIPGAQLPAQERTFRLDDRSFCLFSWIGRGQAHPAVGLQAARIHVSTRADDHLTRAHFNGKDQYKATTRPARGPDLRGTVLAVGDDGARLVLEIKEEQVAAVQAPITLTTQTKELYLRVLTGGAEPRVGYRAAVWLAEGSADQAHTIWFDTRHSVPSR